MGDHSRSEGSGRWAGARCLALRFWSLVGGATFLALFWWFPWPLWSRLLGWLGAATVLWVVPSVPPLQVWYRCALGGHAIRPRRFPRLRPTLAFGPDAMARQQRTAATYLALRCGGVIPRTALGATLAALIVWAVLALVGSESPSLLLTSEARPLGPWVVPGRGELNRVLFAMTLIAAVAGGATLIYRYERARLELPPAPRSVQLVRICWYLLQESVALAWRATFYLGAALFFGTALFLVASVAYYLKYGEVWQAISPESLPHGRPLVEILWVAIAGLLVVFGRARRRLWEAALRGTAFTTSALERAGRPAGRTIHRGISGRLRRL